MRSIMYRNLQYSSYTRRYLRDDILWVEVDATEVLRNIRIKEQKIKLADIRQCHRCIEIQKNKKELELSLEQLKSYAKDMGYMYVDKQYSCQARKC